MKDQIKSKDSECISSYTSDNYVTGGGKIKIVKRLALYIYLYIAQYLPNSYHGKIGKISNSIRVALCKRIFKKCGNIATINRRVNFSSGFDIEMGDGSGIGEHTLLPGDTIIGNNVIIGRYCFIWHQNHCYDRIDIPIQQQGMMPAKQTIIEDDCWIGTHTLMTPGRHLKKGTIVGMGSVVTKDFPEYSIIGGSPAKLIRSRLENNKQ